MQKCKIKQLTYKKEKWCVGTQTAECSAEEQDLERSCIHHGEVKVRRFALNLALVLSLPLGHVLQVQDGPSLWVIEAGRSVKEANKEQRGQSQCYSLETKSPSK